MQISEIKEIKYISRKDDFVEKPWGGYYIVEISDSAKIKRLIINPGCRTSLQMHYYRAEHWVVLNGNGRIILGDEARDIKKNDTIFVPINYLHRIDNNSDELLEILEVQTGSMLSEKDIFRLEDDYGRVAE